MITYGKRTELNEQDVIEVFESSGIVRPITQPSRIKEMIQQADLLYTAWDGDKLVGIARCVTDFSYCCYLSDLAVRKEYQHQGIGKELIDRVAQAIGDEVSLILLSAPGAMDYYPKVGFDKADNAFIVKRKY